MEWHRWDGIEDLELKMEHTRGDDPTIPNPYVRSPIPIFNTCLEGQPP